MPKLYFQGEHYGYNIRPVDLSDIPDDIQELIEQFRSDLLKTEDEDLKIEAQN